MLTPPPALAAPAAPQANDTAAFAVGDWVVVFSNDRSTRPLPRAVQAAGMQQQASGQQATGAMGISIAPRKPPADVLASSAYQAALLGLGWLGEEGEGLTPQQALAADASASAARGRAGAAAANGTLAAWLYGNNRADSGALDGDTLRFSAR